MSHIKDLIIEHHDLLTHVKQQKNYIQYLRKWYAEHSSLHFESNEPTSFKSFCEQQAAEVLKKYPEHIYYTVCVTINEASHIIHSYNHVIKVLAPKDLTMSQLKTYLIISSPFSIEEYIEPTTDTPDVVTVEVYDFDLELTNYTWR
jgi:hypothetical protein